MKDWESFLSSPLVRCCVFLIFFVFSAPLGERLRRQETGSEGCVCVDGRGLGGLRETNDWPVGKRLEIV